jgi:hypothetical protein
LGIKLANVSDAGGIQVGGTRLSGDVTTTRVAPYSGRIRANVRLGTNSDGTGLKILNGELGYVQTHLTVQKEGTKGGTGIDLKDFKPQEKHRIRWDYNGSGPVAVYRPVWENQFSKYSGTKPNNTITKNGFMLATSNIQTPIHTTTQIENKQVKLETDIQTKTFSL